MIAPATFPYGIANRKEVVAVRWLRTLVLQPIGLAN